MIKIIKKGFNFPEVLKKPRKLSEYFQWAGENGVKMHNIDYPAYFHPGYLGFQATETITSNHELLSVPESLLITSKLAENSEIQEILTNPSCPFSKNDSNFEEIALVTYLLFESSKGKDSKWFLFLQNQPRDFDLLQDWSKEELQELQDLEAVYDTKINLENYLDTYFEWKKWVTRCRFPSQLTDKEAFKAAYRVVTTRSFGKFCPYVTLAPIAEFFNHHNTKTYYLYGKQRNDSSYNRRYERFEKFEDNDDQFSFQGRVKDFTSAHSLSTYKGKVNKSADLDWKFEESLKNQMIIKTDEEIYEKGEQVFMSYGRYSNYMLLSNYGFALQDNCYDFARLVLSPSQLSSGSSNFIKNSKKIKYLFKIKLDHLCLDLISSIRFNLSILDLKSSSGIKTFEIFCKLIKEKLESFPTTLNQDLELIRKKMTIRSYFAILYRTSVKNILSRQLWMGQVFLKLFHQVEQGCSLNEAVDRTLNDFNDLDKKVVKENLIKIIHFY